MCDFLQFPASSFFFISTPKRPTLALQGVLVVVCVGAGGRTNFVYRSVKLSLCLRCRRPQAVPPVVPSSLRHSASSPPSFLSIFSPRPREFYHRILFLSSFINVFPSCPFCSPHHRSITSSAASSSSVRCICLPQ